MTSPAEIHTVILDPGYAQAHMSWLKQFVFRTLDSGLYTFVFSALSYQFEGTGMVAFEVVMKDQATAEREHILLPQYAVAGILVGESRQSQFGYLRQE